MESHLLPTRFPPDARGLQMAMARADLAARTLQHAFTVFEDANGDYWADLIGGGRLPIGAVDSDGIPLINRDEALPMFRWAS